MSTETSENILSRKPLLLDPNNSKFPDDILIKINNIICDEYIQKIYIQLEKNYIKNIINIFLNDKKLSKFLYYFGYQTYYFNYILVDNFGVYGETLNNLDWGDFETNVLFEDYKGINIDDETFNLGIEIISMILFTTDIELFKKFANKNKIDAIIWTDLPPNFNNFNTDNALEYINSHKKDNILYKKICIQ